MASFLCHRDSNDNNKKRIRMSIVKSMIHTLNNAGAVEFAGEALPCLERL